MPRSLGRTISVWMLLVVVLVATTPRVLAQSAARNRVSDRSQAAGDSSRPATPVPSTAKGEWPHYTGDLAGTRYSPLDQIRADNFNKLEIAWRFKTDNLGTRPEYKLEGTPLMVKGILYATAGTRRSVVALKADTGEIV